MIPHSPTVIDMPNRLDKGIMLRGAWEEPAVQGFARMREQDA